MWMIFTGTWLQIFIKWWDHCTRLMPWEPARIIMATFCRSQAAGTEMERDILYSQHQKRSTVLGKMPVWGEGGYFGFCCTFGVDELTGLKNAWLWWGASGSAWVTAQQTLRVVLVVLTWPAFCSHKSQTERRKRRSSYVILSLLSASHALLFQLVSAFSPFQSTCLRLATFFFFSHFPLPRTPLGCGAGRICQ